MTTHDPILSGLNPQQLEAVTAPEMPVLIVAGAGTGKTRVITRRIAYLIREHSCFPWQIFAATFTNKAAGEMKGRVCQLLPQVPENDLHIATFHSLCARILRREINVLGFPPSFTIADERDQHSAIKHVMRELAIPDSEIKPSFAQEIINQCKIRMLEPADVGEVVQSRYEEQLATIFEAYTRYMQQSGALDFEDLILMTVKLFTEHLDVLEHYQSRYRHVMVDEFQDINHSQFALVRLLTASHHRLTVVGDEDQTIYSWRGADIRHILDFEKFYPERIVVRLEQNYRSSANILTAAGGVIAHNTERFHKTLFTDAPAGAPVLVIDAQNDREEAACVANFIREIAMRLRISFSEMAVFYRTSALSRTYEEKLRELNLPYRVVGGVRFFDRAEIKDLLAYLQLAQNPGNNLALQRIINTPRRGIGDKSVEQLLRFARQQGISLYEALQRALPEGVIAGSAARAAATLARQIRAWHEMAHSVLPSQLFARIREEIAYDAGLGDPAQMEVRSRIENIDELYNSIVSYETETPEPTLQGYLENVSLLSPTDNLGSEDAVALMTLHMAKGLEFRCVFIVGCNEGLLPHRRAAEEGHVEEERRLFYVGMTRARELLFLTHSYERVYYGEPRYDRPSPFVEEVPPHVVRRIEPIATDVARLVHDLAHGRVTAQPAEAASQAGGIAPAGSPLSPRQPQQAGALGSGLSPATAAATSLLGRRVRHPFGGEGVVVDAGGTGKQRWVVVETEGGSRIKLMLRHATLEVCE